MFNFVDLFAAPGGLTLGFQMAGFRPLLAVDIDRDGLETFSCNFSDAFNLPLTVDIDEMVRYHTGLFGFTGCGKSNLASFLLRKVLQNIPDLAITA